jgi:hypothetical protein
MRDRNEATHNAIAVEMLYRAIIGPAPTSNPELQAFCEGFLLPCSNGFTFENVCVVHFLYDVCFLTMNIQVTRDFEGGSEGLLRQAWSSRITSLESLSGCLRIDLPSIDEIMEFPVARIPFASTFRSFLGGVGIPCPALFEEAKAHFSPMLDLARINEPSFRPRMFTWAATGSPYSPSHTIQVCHYFLYIFLEYLYVDR